ncbi:putative ABC transport system permease protein [Okibacterium sp. HSC-33S16]|uniref:ABC transporter permease n=1 Tax=Okibacterium sp. HSC-33S16 TaxID=2910965 RepID=UPI00209E689A|nr:ABC transporter permease [Okibacterium sp. HSC-33S16]MCP2030713.1 putative ABC transport system permease protein [Okibacterium sp. HSC-33S16]
MIQRIRRYASTFLVAALSGAFGTILVQGTAVLTTLIAGDDIGAKNAVKVALGLVSLVFFGIAIFVGGLVTTNTVSTVIAGRTRELALFRLIGSSASRLRTQIAVDGLVIGLLGAIAGLAVGMALTGVSVTLGIAADRIPQADYGLISPGLVGPVVAVALVTWLAAWVGSRRVLEVTPIQAAAASVEPSREEATHRPLRNGIAYTLIALGLFLLAAGVALGLISMLGVLVGMLGGILSFTGIVLAAPVFMPPLLHGMGRLLGRSPAARIAAANAVRNPARSARTTIGLVIGVTLVTMFAVAAQNYYDVIQRSREAYPADYGDSDQILALTITVFAVLFGFSAIIAAVGMVNNLSLSVLQRRRELGLLRALGFTKAQIRLMILAESAQMTLAAVGFGLILGILYGWAGAQALLGSILGGGFALPAVPWLVLGLSAVAAAVLAAAASVAPARRATRISPVAALAVE